MSSPAPLPPWQPRKTVIDLYNERDCTPGWVRVIASLSAVLLMTGFIILPTAFFDFQPLGLSVSPNAALIGCLILTLVALFTSIALAVLTTSWLFHLDAILIPHLLMSILGLITCIFALGSHTKGQFNGRMVGGLVLAVVLTIAYSAASLLSFRKIYMVRAREALHRHNSTSTAKTFAMPENEMQRQQLMRLLTSQGGADREAGTLDSSAGAEATYKIHWPTAPASQHSRHLTNTSMRHLPFAQRGSRSGSRRSSMTQNLGFPPPPRNYRRPSDALNGATDRMPELPDIIVEEPTMSNTHTHNNPPQPQSAGAATPLRPNVYNPLLPAFFEHHPGDRVPSYHPRVISQYSYVPTPRSYAGGPPTPGVGSPPPLPAGPNDWPLEKKSAQDEISQPFERLKGHRPPLDNYVVVDADPEAGARTMGAVRGGPTQTRAEIELADRGKEGARVGTGEFWKRW